LINKVTVSFPHLFLYYHTKKKNPGTYHSSQSAKGQFWTIFRPIGGKVVFVVSSCRRFLGELNLGASCSRQYFIELDFGHPVTLAWLQLKSVSCWVK